MNAVMFMRQAAAVTLTANRGVRTVGVALSTIGNKEINQ